MDAENRWVVLAIGNDEPRYEKTRHNVGWWVAERLLKDRRFNRSAWRNVHVSWTNVGSAEVLVAFPTTYVNRSGDAAKFLQDRFEIASPNFIVVSDDINLPVGRIRVRRGGSAGGHNGIKSVIQKLGTDAFPRVRIGVGKQADGENQIDYVLGRPTEEELEPLNDAVKRAASAVKVLIQHGVEEAMDRYNRRPKTDAP